MSTAHTLELLGWTTTLTLRIAKVRMKSSDKWENLAEVLRGIEGDLENKLAFCRNNPPSSLTQPVTRAVIAGYLTRLELRLAAIRGGGQSLRNEFRIHPRLTQEIREFETWILRRKSGIPRPKLRDVDEAAIGNWFVSKMAYSYSQTKDILQSMQQVSSGKGAPNKRPETLRLLDASIANRWSYKELARRKCDCGLVAHNEYCEDRIRKRIEALQSFLRKYALQPDTSMK